MKFDFMTQSVFRLLRVSKTSYKLAIILVLSIIIPMIIFGYLSLSISIETDFKSVSKGNQRAALRTAEQVDQYISNNISILQSISESISGLHLTKAQKETIINNYVLKFKEFEKIVITNSLGEETATSEMGDKLRDRSEDVAFKKASKGRLYFSEVYMSDNHIPTITIGMPYKLRGRFSGSIIGDLNFVNMWRHVDSLTIGKQGYAILVSKDGMLLAHGKGDSKVSIIKNTNIGQLKIVEKIFLGEKPVLEYKSSGGIMSLGVAAPVKKINWALIIEQPLSEAYASTYKMGKTLAILGFFILFLMSFIAYAGVNSAVIKPLRKLTGAIKDKGMFVDIVDDFSSLEKFHDFLTNTMSTMEETIEKHSKSAATGKMSIGLIHDLKTPIANIIRITKHLTKQVSDKELKKISEEVMENSSKNIENIISEASEPIAAASSQEDSVYVNMAINNQTKSFQERLKENNIRLDKALNPLNPKAQGKPSHLERVISNLINNAIEAMDNGGTLTLSSKSNNGNVKVIVSDTGCGLKRERIETLFTSQGSTKKEGWGVGLNGSKELIEKMGGTITVDSVLGKGSTFTLNLQSY